jgi:hypothetical protein
MAYSLTNLTSIADCDLLIGMLTKEQEDLVFQQVVQTKRADDLSDNSVDFQTDLISVQGELDIIEGVIAALPNGPQKEKQLTAKLALELRLRRLNERKDNYGPVGLINAQYQIEVLDLTLTSINNLIADVQTRRAQIGA